MSHETHQRDDCHTIPWRKREVRGCKLQRSISHATTRGETTQAHRLHKRLASSWRAPSLAVRRVPQDNTGQKTAGVDGKSHRTPSQRLPLISAMHLHAPAQPVRRVWIPKPGTPAKRPLGLPVIPDRGPQALAQLALAPAWEAPFEPKSLGCSPGRSCPEAIRPISTVIRLRLRSGRDADLASGFDTREQAALLAKMATSPLCARPRKDWRKAGGVDQAIFKAIQEGTPPGGVRSPLLAHRARHGREDVARRTGGPACPRCNGKQLHHRTPCIRYADDFVILQRTWAGLQRGQEAIQAWVQGMGRARQAAKTRFAPPLQPRRPVRAMGALLVLASPSDHPQSDHTWQANTT